MMALVKESYTHYKTPSGNTHVFVYRRKMKKKLTEQEKYLVNQKILGLALTVIGILGCLWIPEDCGGFIVAVLIGIARIITN